jgi:hypothetical protein
MFPGTLTLERLRAPLFFSFLQTRRNMDLRNSSAGRKMKCGRFCWFVFIGLAYAQSANPIKVTFSDAITGGLRVVIENDSPSVLTAIAFRVQRSQCQT